MNSLRAHVQFTSPSWHVEPSGRRQSRPTVSWRQSNALQAAGVLRTLQAGSDVADAVLVDPSGLEPYRLTPKATTIIAKAFAMATIVRSPLE